MFHLVSPGFIRPVAQAAITGEPALYIYAAATDRDAVLPGAMQPSQVYHDIVLCLMPQN